MQVLGLMLRDYTPSSSAKTVLQGVTVWREAVFQHHALQEHILMSKEPCQGHNAMHVKQAEHAQHLV